MTWPGVPKSKSAGCLESPAGRSEGCASPSEWRREAPAGPWAPLNAMLFRPRMCWPLGPLENQFLTSSQQHCPGPGHPEVVVTAKPSAMETVVQPQEQAAWRAGQALRSARCSFCFYSHSPLLCYAWQGSLWTQRHSFCRETCKLAPPFHAKRPAQLAPPPPFWLLPSSSLFLLKIVSAWAPLVESGRWPRTPGVGTQAGPALLNSTVFAPQALPELSLLAAGSPSCCGPGISGGQKTETSPVFSKLPGRLLRNSGLSPGTRTPPSAHPCLPSEKGLPAPSTLASWSD